MYFVEVEKRGFISRSLYIYIYMHNRRIVYKIHLSLSKKKEAMDRQSPLTRVTLCITIN